MKQTLLFLRLFGLIMAMGIPSPRLLAQEPAQKVCRLGAIGVRYKDLDWYLGLDYDFIAGVTPDASLGGTREQIHSLLQEHGIEYFDYKFVQVNERDMAPTPVPPERRLVRKPGIVCTGWDETYKCQGRLCVERFNELLESRQAEQPEFHGGMDGIAEEGLVLEDYSNHLRCFCNTCREQYRRDSGRPDFPESSFDSAFLALEHKRIARQLGLMSAPIHELGKKVAIAGLHSELIDAEAAKNVDYLMFYTYYWHWGQPPNVMRSWKFYNDQVANDNLWVVIGYFRGYYPFATRLAMANVPDGVGLAFWACYRQVLDPMTKEDAVYAHDVATSHLVPIRIAVYASDETQRKLPTTTAARRQPVSPTKGPVVSNHSVEPKAVIGFQQLGLDADVISSLDKLDDYDLLYLEDVECISQAEIDHIKQSKIPILATGLSGLRDHDGKLWAEKRPVPSGAADGQVVLNLPQTIVLTKAGSTSPTKSLHLEYRWFDFLTESVSPERGDLTKVRPFTDPIYFRGVKQHRLSLLPSGTTFRSARLLQSETVPVARGGTYGEPLIVYDGASFVYSTIKFSDYVDVSADHKSGHNMQQLCFLQIIDALTLPRRGVSIEPYLMTAVRRTNGGHFLTIGNPYDQEATVRINLARHPTAVRINRKKYNHWNKNVIPLPPIEPKGAIHVCVDYL